MSKNELVTMSSRFDDLFLPKTKEDLFKLSEMYSKSNLAPVCFRNKPADIVIAWSLGMPLGLNMMQCLLGIAVINGRPSLWGDVLNGLVLSQPDLETFNETFNESEFKWTCTIKRKGRDEVSRTFSRQEAEDAGLLPGKEGSAWKKYPKRMTQMRARGFCIRDSYSDKTSGLGVEPGELIDITDSTVVTDNPKTNIVDKIAAKVNDITEPTPNIADKIAAKAENANETPHGNEQEGPPPEATPKEKDGEYKDIQEVIDSFRSAADIQTLRGMQDLVNKVEPAFRQEAKTALDRVFEDLNQENPGSPTTDKTHEGIKQKDDVLLKELRRICISINTDKKAEIAKELFNDGRKTKFRVSDLSSSQLLKLKEILKLRGFYQEDE